MTGLKARRFEGQPPHSGPLPTCFLDLGAPAIRDQPPGWVGIGALVLGLVDGNALFCWLVLVGSCLFLLIAFILLVVDLKGKSGTQPKRSKDENG